MPYRRRDLRVSPRPRPRVARPTLRAALTERLVPSEPRPVIPQATGRGREARRTER